MTDHEKIEYYDAMLAEDRERAKCGLGHTEEYRRLSALCDEKPTPLGNGLVAVPREVSDFLEAFDRARARNYPVM